LCDSQLSNLLPSNEGRLEVEQGCSSGGEAVGLQPMGCGLNWATGWSSGKASPSRVGKRRS